MAHVGRILAAKLEAGGRKTMRGGLHDRPSPGNRARETDIRDAWIAHQARSCRMRKMQILEHARRQAGRGERLREALGTQRRLVRGFQHHGVAGDQRGQHRIHRGQIWIIPWCNHDDDA